MQRLDVRREGAPFVADRLRQALTGALAAPGLDAAAREARTLELLGDMLAAGRGPALVRFSPADRGAVVRLMQAWPAASPQRQAELMQAHAGLFTALERALGGGMVGAPPGFAAEQVDRGNPLPTWLSAPASTGLHHDLELIIEAQRLQGRLQRGLR